MKTKLFLYFATVMLLTILIQGACKKETDADPMTDEELSYISREEFISKLQGKWSGNYFSLLSGEYPLLNLLQISFTQDTCRYEATANYPQMYPLNDPILCTLPHMGKIQNWTITSSNDDLILKTQSWCGGDTVTYEISFSNHRYGLKKDWLTGKKHRTNQILADIQLINAEIIILYNFWFNDELKELGFGKLGIGMWKPTMISLDLSIADLPGPRKSEVKGILRVPLALAISATASRAVSAMVPSAAGRAWATLPPRVAVLRTCGPAIRLQASVKAWA